MEMEKIRNLNDEELALQAQDVRRSSCSGFASR